MIDDDDDDARHHWKKWRRHDNLAVTVNDATPWFPLYLKFFLQPGMAQGNNVSQLQQRLTQQRMPNQMGQQQRPQMMGQQASINFNSTNLLYAAYTKLKHMVVYLLVKLFAYSDKWRYERFYVSYFIDQDSILLSV